MCCCIADCGSLDGPVDGTVSVSGTDYQSVATYTCLPGYALIGQANRICQLNETWSGQPPTCKIRGRGWGMKGMFLTLVSVLNFVTVTLSVSESVTVIVT